MSTRKIRRVITTMAAFGLASVLGAVPATAQDVIATDTSGTPVAEAAQPKATQPQATASIPRGIVVARPGGSAVTLTAKGPHFASRGPATHRPSSPVCAQARPTP
jgi:Zn-dependent alcohol dehydrogenase